MKKVLVIVLPLFLSFILSGCGNQKTLTYNKKYIGEEGYIMSFLNLEDDKKNSEYLSFNEDGTCSINLITKENTSNCKYELNESEKKVYVKYKKNNVDEEIVLEIVTHNELKLIKRTTSGFEWPKWVEEINGYPHYSVTSNPSKKINNEIVILDNYIGKNYNDVKKLLEEKEIKVLINKQEVSDINDYVGKEELITNQSAIYYPLKKGDTVTLYIPNMVVSE